MVLQLTGEGRSFPFMPWMAGAGMLILASVLVKCYLPILAPEFIAGNSPFIATTIAALNRIQVLDGEKYNLDRFGLDGLTNAATGIADLPERSRISFNAILCSRAEAGRLDLLLSAMRDKSIFVRCDAIIGSRRFSTVDNGVIRAELLVLSHDGDPQVRRHIAEALGYFSGPECERRLWEMTRDQDDMVVYYSIGALERMGKVSNDNLATIGSLVNHKHPLVRIQAESIFKKHDALGQK